MQNFSQTADTLSKIAFVTKLEDIPGGVTVASADLPAGLPAGQYYIPEGSVVGLDAATGLWHLLKTAIAQAAVSNSVTAYPVLKGHAFKVGDFFGLGYNGKAVTITSIDTSNAAFDTINTDATIGTAVLLNQAFAGAAAAAASASTLPYTQYAVINNDVQIKTGDNHLVGAWIRATLKIAVAPGVPASIQTLLANGTLKTSIFYV